MRVIMTPRHSNHSHVPFSRCHSFVILLSARSEWTGGSYARNPLGLSHSHLVGYSEVIMNERVFWSAVKCL